MDESGEAQSQLFLLRVWTAPDPFGKVGYRGKLQQVAGNGSYCFASVPELCALLATMLPDPDARMSQAPPTPGATETSDEL